MNPDNLTDPNLAPSVTLRDLLYKLNELPAEEGNAALDYVQLQAGDVLFAEGAEANSLYLLLAGALGVRVAQPDGSELVIDKLAPGATIGEMALQGDQKRTATVYALNDAGLLRLTRAAFDRLPAVQQSALVDAQTTVARWQRVQLAGHVHKLFGELDTNALHLLQSQVGWQHLSNGDILFNWGDAADGMYLVVNGRLRFRTPADGNEEELTGEIGPGDTVGEFALLTDDVRSATVYATRETTVVKITPALFERLVRTYPQFMERMAQVIIRRQQALRPVKPAACTRLTLALVPAGAGADSAGFAHELAAALAPFGRTAALTRYDFEEKFGRSDNGPGPARTAVIAWLSEQETVYDYLILAAEPELTAWTERCIGQSDRVLIVADPHHDPAPGAVEQMAARKEVPVRTELVLWHPPETARPAGTLAWLEPRRLAAHHHLRRGNGADMARLARWLLNRAVALVLSGGAARGFAHAGVLRAMEELDLPIDYVSGTSMGSVIGASIANHLSYEEIMRQSATHGNAKALFDRTLPLTSLMASKKVTAFTQTVYGDLQIEDLWRPFFCVATNLTTAEAVVYRTGPLWRAVRASLAIPGVFAPVMDDGDVIVDGGVMDNFPVRLTAQHSESAHIIGVNVSPHRDKKRYYDFDTSISGWRVLFSRINPFRKPLRSPSLVGTLLRTLEINSVHRAKEEEALADLLIYPDVKAFASTAYDQYADIAAVGYETAVAPLRAWKERTVASLGHAA